VVVFLTSLRHPDSSNDYGQVLTLFERTARSVCSQTNPNLAFVVSCNEIPDIPFKDDRIHYHKVDFPIPCHQDGDIPLDEMPTAGTSDRVKRDKGSKLLSGLLYMRDNLSAEYVYIIDADDWVNNCVVEHMLAAPRHPVWCADSGYLVNNVTKRMKKRYGITRYCGSTFAYQRDYLLSLTTFAEGLDGSSSQRELIEGTSKYYVYEVCGDHSNTFEYAKKQGVTPKSFPFPAISWVVETGENVSRSSGGDQGMPVNAERLRAFGLPDDMLNNESPELSTMFYESLSGARSRVTWWLTKFSGKKYY